ncbi:MAG: hypothetical protein BAA04_01905 [Firmicutes bacterium ZCTH02-B6]|nr:MAG: hypothetical protein BAA04_01905 [Firmicutes bacterium ZCTH02-B6]
MSGNRIVWWWEARLIVAFVLWFLAFERLWELGKLVTSGRGFELPAAANAVLLLTLAILASWRMPSYPSR